MRSGKSVTITGIVDNRNQSIILKHFPPGIDLFQAYETGQHAKIPAKILARAAATITPSKVQIAMRVFLL